MIKLYIGELPGKIDEYGFETPVTVRQALSTAGIDPTGKVVKFDDEPVALDDEITTDGVLALARQIKGN